MSAIRNKKHNFTQLEKKAFIDILKKYLSIVENKDTDGSTLRAKNMAWESITNEFNSSPHATTEVTNKQLRRLWMNLKQRLRDALTKEKQYRLATGGGPSTSSAVIEALIVGIDEAIDSDTILESVDVTEMDLNETMDSQPASSQGILSQTPSTSANLIMPTTPQPLVLAPPAQSSTTSLPPTPTTPTPPSQPEPSTSSTSTSFQRHKNTVLEKEYRDRLRRADEIHELEKELLRQKIREAIARAELAELCLQQQQQRSTGTGQRNEEFME